MTFCEINDQMWVIRTVSLDDQVNVFMYGYEWDDQGDRLGTIYGSEVPEVWNRGVRAIAGKTATITEKERGYLMDNPAQFMALELLWPLPSK